MSSTRNPDSVTRLRHNVKPQRPPVGFNPDRVPRELRDRDQWLVWVYTKASRTPKGFTKIPIDVHTGSKGNATDPSVWVSFEEALAFYDENPGCAGLGFALTGDDPFVVVDLDHCIQDGKFTDDSEGIIRALGTYTERSPSGDGVKCFCFGKKPGPRSAGGGIEMYEAGRYLAVTGRTVGKDYRKITDCQPDIERLYEEHFPQQESPSTLGHAGDRRSLISDEEVLDRALNNKKGGPDFKRLFEDGDDTGFESPSEVDFALASKLAFWCNGDLEQMKRLMIRSALIRDKWSSHPDYLDRTLRTAVDKCRSFFGTSRSDDRPLLVSNSDFNEVLEQASSHLLNSNSPPWLFRYGSHLAIIRQVPSPSIEVLRTTRLREEIARRLQVVKRRETSKTVIDEPVPPPTDLLACLIETPRLNDIPRLRGASVVPTIGPDGTIPLQFGYHHSTETFLATDEFDELDLAEIDPKRVSKAIRWFRENPLCDFPFADEASFTHAICAMLLPIVRPIIKGPTPLHIIDAPTRSSGKSLLARFIISSASDHAFDGSFPTGEDEARKALFSILVEGYTHVLIDNATGLISSSVLDKILTSEEHTDRVLGASKTVKTPNLATWLLTSNNVEMAGDLPSRTILIRLDPNIEKPETRTDFKIPDIVAWGKDYRARVILRLLILVAYWAQSGMPLYDGDGIHRMAAWRSVLGGICECVGLRDFLGNATALETRADSEHRKSLALVERWISSSLADKWVSADDLLIYAYGAEDDDVPGPLWDEFIDSKSDRSKVIALGRWLGKHEDRVFAGRKLKMKHDPKLRNTYKLQVLD